MRHNAAVPQSTLLALGLRAGPPTQLFARAADFSDATMDCDVTEFYETFFCYFFGIY